MAFCVLFIATALFCLPLKSQSQVATDTTGAAAALAEGRRLLDANRYKEAIPQFEHAQALYALVSDAKRQVECLKWIGMSYKSLSKYKESESAFVQTIAIVEEKLRNESGGLVPGIYHQYANMLLIKGDLDKSNLIFEKALKEAEARCNPDEDKIFGSLCNGLASVCNAQGNYIKSEAMLLKALDAYKKAGFGMEETYRTHLNLGIHYTTLLDFDRAFNHLHLVEKWVDAIAVVPPYVQIEAVYFSLSYLHALNGNRPKSIEYGLKAVEQVKKKYGPAQYRLVDIYNNIAGHYVQDDRLTEAMAYFNLALQVADVVCKQACEKRIHVYINMAICKHKEGSESESEIYWEKAIAEAQGVEQLTKKREILSVIHKARADIYAKGRKYADAVRYYQESIAMLGYPEVEDARALPSGLTALGRTLVKTGHMEEAMPYLNQAIRLQTKSKTQPDSKGHLPDTAFLLTGKVPFTLLGKAEAMLAHWKKKQEKESLADAEKDIEQAIRLTDRFRQRYQKSRSENFEWFQNNRNLYCVGVEVALQQYLAQKDPGQLERAFQLADRSKAVLLSESVQDMEAKQYAGLPPDVLQTEQQLRRDISFYETSAFEAISKNPNAAKARSQDSLLFVLKRRQEAMIQDLEQRYPRYYEHRYATASVKASEIQKTLDPDALFIEYMLDIENNQVYIFTIDHSSSLKVKVAPLDSAVNEQVRELNRLASSIFLVRKDKKARFIELSHALYKQLLKPIEALLYGKNELIIIPDGSLNYLPFELLLKAPTDAPFQSLRYLLHDFEVKYHYSGALYLRNAANIDPFVDSQAESADVSDRSLLAFAPVFDNTNTTDNSNEALALRNRSAVDTTLRSTFADGEFVPLPYSEQEARTIVQLFGGQNTKMLLYQAADEAALKAELQKKRRIAHIATHSFANLKQPQFSGIACAQPTDSTATEDGVLYVSEIYNLNIPADLVVLSSCESGLGKLAGSEGLLGLNRAFAYAGVPNIVYSLWKVNDKASSELMIEFYKQVLLDKSYSTALRAAKLKMLENPTTASPNFWSGFLLMGR